MNNLSRRSNDIALLLCVALLFAMVSPGGMFIVAIVGLSFARLLHARSSDTIFLRNLFLASFTIRAVLLVLISVVLIIAGRILTYPDYPGWAPNLIGDASYYTLRAYWMSLDWRGFDLSDKVLLSTYNPIYGWNGYTFMIAFFHYIFGFSPVMSVMFNCLLGSCNGILIFFIAREYLSGGVAKIAAVLVSFLPSLVLWSITNLKDTVLITVTLFIVLVFIRLQRSAMGHRFVLILLLIAALVLQSAVRKYSGLLTGSALLLSLMFLVRTRRARLVLIFVLLIVGITVTVTPGLANKINERVHMSVYRLLSIHQATVPMPGSSYKILDDKYYKHNPEFKVDYTPDVYYYQYPTWQLSYLDYAGIYCRAMVHFLFEPFPWAANSSLKLLSLIQMGLWYCILACAAFGAVVLSRHAFREYACLYVFFLIMSFFIAMTQGNVGTLFRVRDIVTPIILLWASVGIAGILKIDIIKKDRTYAPSR